MGCPGFTTPRKDRGITTIIYLAQITLLTWSFIALLFDAIQKKDLAVVIGILFVMILVIWLYVAAYREGNS